MGSIEAMPHHKITAKTIREIRDMDKEKPVIDDPTVKVSMSVDAYYYLKEAAKDRGVSPTKMLDFILIPDLDTETIVSGTKKMIAMEQAIQKNGGFEAAMKKVQAIYDK